MCVDFINLNKACLNVSYMLSKIDKVVACIAGHELLSFMDVFSAIIKFL